MIKNHQTPANARDRIRRGQVDWRRSGHRRKHNREHPTDNERRRGPEIRRGGALKTDIRHGAIEHAGNRDAFDDDERNANAE
jgi:hypothetical protein